MIIDRILAQVIDCRACALQNKTHKETCGNVTGAAIMCGICEQLTMDTNLLQKEEDFHKQNAELELKTKKVLKEVEGMMKIQDKLSKNENSVCTRHRSPAISSLSEIHTVALNESWQGLNVNSCISSSTSRNQPAIYPKDGSTRRVRNELSFLNMQVDSQSSSDVPLQRQTEDEILFEVGYGMSADSITRVLRAKLKGLQKEMEALQVDYNKQTESWNKLQAEMKTLEEDRNKWQQQAGTLRDTLKKQEILASSTAAKLTQQESENIALKKELETIKKELRTAVQTCKASEVRLNRSVEELEKLRTAVHNHERDDKELRDLTRKKDDKVAVDMKRLEKQKTELLLGFKKQMQLIDNLKKQKDHLQAACMMQFSEQEFLKLLDWNPSKKQSEHHT